MIDILLTLLKMDNVGCFYSLLNSSLLPDGPVIRSMCLSIYCLPLSCPLRRNLGDVADPRETQLVHLNRQLEEIVETLSNEYHQHKISQQITKLKHNVHQARKKRKIKTHL